MKRKITDKLKEWKDKSFRKPMLIRGARQVGKSYSVTDFGKTYFSERFHTINFEKNPELNTIFDPNLEP